MDRYVSILRVIAMSVLLTCIYLYLYRLTALLVSQTIVKCAASALGSVCHRKQDFYLSLIADWLKRWSIKAVYGCIS